MIDRRRRREGSHSPGRSSYLEATAHEPYFCGCGWEGAYPETFTMRQMGPGIGQGVCLADWTCPTCGETEVVQ